MSSAEEKTAVLEQIELSASLMGCQNGFDVVVICTNTEMMAQFWQERLEASRGSVIPSNAVVLSVFEDWPGGAGNALGTLYAWQKACSQAKSKGIDLNKQLSNNEVSCALFHTAGKGTRLAPLPGSENNNKPGVKLPTTIEGENKAMTILESVIKQTGIYASSRKGRLSVFWGDQVFIPSVSPLYTPEHHADILCTLGPMPGAVEWKEKGLDKYGLIAVGSGNEAAQVEKVDHETALRLLSSLGEVSSVGASLGSFSVSSTLLSLLMEEFSSELAAKKGKLDTDPGLWMPLTLSKVAYVEIMKQKGDSSEQSTNHYDRMMKVKEQLTTNHSSMKLFGAVDVGTDAYWWDYGQLVLYRKNNLKLLDSNHEAITMKKFFNFPKNNIKNSELNNTIISNDCCISSSHVKNGNIKSSLLCKVTCSDCECEGAILVNVTATKIKVAPGCIVYNVVSTDPEGIVIDKPGSILTSTLQATNTGANSLTIRSHLDLDGGKVWKQKVLGNDFSFEDIYNSNSAVDVSSMDKISTSMHSSAAVGILAPTPECTLGCSIS
mmetsp:Transcript_10852/g.14122  ORF Transcript_10852/g.14122 Transcript_10852/m.14122 type:complete len:549 (-) Transcript_10852:64-1710(-)